MPPANSRSCAQNAIGNLTSEEFSGDQWNGFTIGVEAVVQLNAFATDVTTEQTDLIKTAIAAEVGVEESAVEIEVTAGFNSFSHLWVRMQSLKADKEDGQDIDQGQQVKANLSAVLEDTEKAQIFLNRALGPFPATFDASTITDPTLAPSSGDGIKALLVDAVVVPPTVLCFPDTSGASTAEGAPGAFGIIGLIIFALVLLANLAYFAYKRWKDMKEADADDDDDDDEPQILATEGEGEDEGDDDGEGEDDDGGTDGDPLNESGLNLLKFLNTQMTPGLDDSPDMKVNPVLMYCIERMKKEEKQRAEAEAAEDGEEVAQSTAAAADDAPKGDAKVSAIKRLGWSLSKDAAVQADTTKQIKNIEQFLAKSLDIDVKKSNMTRAVKAGERTHNALEVSRLAMLHSQDKQSGAVKSEASAETAQLARAQLKQLKLKTKVEDDTPAIKEEDGEEGEEGAGEAEE